MDWENKNIIPINKPMIDALKNILDCLKDIPWNGPKEFNAIFIDRKGFMKQGYLPNPPPPVYSFAVHASANIRMIRSVPELSSLPSCVEKIEFRLYRRIGDTLEYREFI